MPTPTIDKTTSALPLALSLAALVLATAAFGMSLLARMDETTPQVENSPQDQAGQSMNGDLVRDYLLANPEVILQAMNVLEARDQAQAEEAARATLVAMHDEIYQDAMTPMVGAAEPDVVIVEFFDYRCPYCKHVAPDVRAVLEDDPLVAVAFKEWPILSAESVVAARAGIAAHRQGLYEAFHFALIMEPGDMSLDHVLAIAASVDLDVARLQEDMQDPEVTAALRRNYDLAEALGVRGTPAFIIGDTLVPGAVDANEMRRLIALARADAG